MAIQICGHGWGAPVASNTKYGLTQNAWRAISASLWLPLNVGSYPSRKSRWSATSGQTCTCGRGRQAPRSELAIISSLPAEEGSLFLTFWRHGWSGHVRILTSAGTVGEWDLYSAVPWLTTFQVDSFSPGKTIRIQAAGSRNDLSKGHEVILYRASWRSTQAAALRLAVASQGGSRAAGATGRETDEHCLGDLRGKNLSMTERLDVAIVSGLSVQRDALSASVRDDAMSFSERFGFHARVFAYKNEYPDITQ